MVITGAVTLDAVSEMRATALADGGGASGLSVTVMLPSATVSGTTRAYLGEGAAVQGDSVRVDARGKEYKADAKTISVSVAGASGQGSDAAASVSGTVEAFLGAAAGTVPGPVRASISAGSGVVTVEATSSMTALAKADGGAGGGIVAVYQRHDYADEKRQALEAWGRFVLSLVEGKADNVVQLAGART